MPTEPIKPVKRRACERQSVERESSLPALEKIQRLTHDRMIRREDTVNRVRAAIKYEGPMNPAHYHD